MNRYLLILTSHRLDCLKINLELMDRHGSFSHFDRTILLLNGVEGEHRAYIERFMADRPDVAWDTIAGPRGRSECISNLENVAIRKYPDGMYVKIDEDVFVSSEWAPRMIEAFEAHADEEDLGLVTPLVPNNAYGLYQLLTRYDGDAYQDYQANFPFKLGPGIDSETWAYGSVAEWATRRYLDIEAANREHRERMASEQWPRYERFPDRFSIGCIAFSYHHWEKMGGVPPKDEPEWCAWIQENGQFNVLDTSHIVNHYAFFVQQDWLDRSSLIEDLRRVNLPHTMPAKSLAAYHLPRWSRTLRQIPSALVRRLRLSK